MTGIPPRMGLPSSYADSALMKNRSSPPTTRQEVTCAPWRYTSAEAPDSWLSIAFGRPFTPGTKPTAPGMPNCSVSSSSIASSPLGRSLDTPLSVDEIEREGNRRCRAIYTARYHPDGVRQPRPRGTLQTGRADDTRGGVCGNLPWTAGAVHHAYDTAGERHAGAAARVDSPEPVRPAGDSGV
ncbi:MAG: hypothetical protein BWY76_03406 [bacterium ADurb.Bin429]|nr:MAG: hypothetical protein BWY76_03406 [bacterium ADurb.Bin429]